MYDRPTNSLWNNLTGKPVAGRLAESGDQARARTARRQHVGSVEKTPPGDTRPRSQQHGLCARLRSKPLRGLFCLRQNDVPRMASERGARDQATGLHPRLGRAAESLSSGSIEGRARHARHPGRRGIVLLTNAQSGAVRAYRTKARHFVLVSDTELREEPPGIRWRVRERSARVRRRVRARARCRP